MSSVPGEVLRDVLLPLDRGTLDDVQFTDRRFLQLIMNRMSDVCLRQVAYASFRAPTGNAGGTSFIRIGGWSKRKISSAHGDTSLLFSEFVQALRSSRVEFLALNGLVFTSDLSELVLLTPIVADVLSLAEGSCAEQTPALFREVLLHFSPTSLDITACYLRERQITDELIRALSKNRVRRIKFPNMVAVDGGSFAVTDDAIVDFCMQEDVPIGQGLAALEPCGELAVHFGSFTEGLFKRLLEASSVSTRTQPLRIVVTTSPVEEEDLRDFAQHLSYRHRGTPWQWRIYDFPGTQHAAVGAMHLQIVLRPDNRLELIRARRPHRFFYEPDE